MTAPTPGRQTGATGPAVRAIRAGETHEPERPLAVAVPPALLDAIAERVAALLADREAPEPEPWVGVEAAAEHLACPRSRIYALVSAGRMPHCKDGSRLLFRRSELDAWLADGGGKRP